MKSVNGYEGQILTTEYAETTEKIKVDSFTDHCESISWLTNMKEGTATPGLNHSTTTWHGGQIW